jgi:HAE1 family hydrophobic/amphiphilic exporter-1
VGVGGAGSELESEKGENMGEITVTIGPPHLRPFSDEDFMDWTRKALANEVNLDLRLGKPQLFTFKNPVELEISGFNLDDLRAASQAILTRIQDVLGLSDLEASIREANPEVAITVDRNRASAFGLTVGEVTDVIRKKVKGERATRYDRGDRQEDIVVETRPEDRATLADLGNLSIALPAGGQIPLKAVAEIKPTRGPGAITRVGNSRVALIQGNLTHRPLGAVVRDIEARLQPYQPPRGVYWRVAGQNEEMKRSLSSLYLALALAIALVYLVMAAQFESLLQPFVIMFSVPFSVIGLAVVFVLTGQTINVFTLIGILMMLGICVNDAIVLVTTINDFRGQGMDRGTALVNAGSARLRPILITTLTTVLGMVPMAIVFGAGSELRAPMALAVIGGLTTSTIFTLLVIPALYLIFDRVHSLFTPLPAASDPAE